MRQFHIGDVLSVTTGRLLSPRHMDGVYDILNYLCDDNLFTHQLPRANDLARPFVLEQHPQLVDVIVPEDRPDGWHISWMAEQIARYGETLGLLPIPPAQREHRHPTTELEEMVGSERIIVVETSELD